MKMKPMLASNLPDVMPGTSPTDALTSMAQTGDYLFDVKWDGVRCIAAVWDGQVELTNRNGRVINERYPDVVEMLERAFPVSQTSSVHLDGELVVFNEQGKPDFGLISRRDRVGSAGKARQAAKQLPATFVVFDLLEHDGTLLTEVAYLGRRALLERLVANGPGLVVSPASEDGETMWAFVQEQQLEGLIAKRTTSQYHAGRHTAWVKLKDVKRVTCLVTGMEEGKGKAEGMMGKLHLALYDEQGELVSVGKVGTGFSDAERKRWWTNKHWTAANVPIEVEYQNVTDDGVLRFPSYKGERADLDPSDCNTDQLA